jgi:CheY-like chemotaxis protein
MDVAVAEKKHILIVDDVAENIQILVSVLKDEYTIAAAKSAEAALDVLSKKKNVDLIILDVVMPGMDGYELCRKLKSDAATRDIPVVFVTSLSEETDEEAGLLAGGIDYLTKPIKPAIVRARIRNHILLQEVKHKLEDQNKALVEAAGLREKVEMMTRHDLKGPLNSIIVYPDILLMTGGLTERQEDALNEIRSAGYRMLNMINRSLDVYKMEEGKYTLKAVSVNLFSVLKSISNEVKRLASDKGVVINVYSPSGDLSADTAFEILGEEMLCHTIFSNLVKNAVEASPKDEEVVIGISREEEMMVVTISNKGVVPEEIRGQFFDKLITAGKRHGTGLGTYSAMLSARTQGGDIRMSSSPENGTELKVFLPVFSG